MRQIPFDLSLPPRFGAEDFLVHPATEVAFETLGRWPDWPGHVMLLVGPEGAGKSHLGTVWAARAQAHRFVGPGLGASAAMTFADTHALIDDADRIGSDEAALFHRLNILRESGRTALLTARRAPDNWGLRTADLLSRLRLAPMVRLGHPDEASLQAILVKLLTDRQLVVDAAVLAFLARRMERSLAAARRLVAALDHQSLAVGRRVTRAVAADVLALLEGEDTSGHGVVTGVGQNHPDP